MANINIQMKQRNGTIWDNLYPKTKAENVEESASKRFVTDTEKSTWNSKQNALGFTPENSANKGVANGYAELDSNGHVPASQLPSYVDDVIEFASQAEFPGTGETGKIYITQDTNKTYRWSGSAYVEISASLALGETSATAYRGDRGKTAYDHSQTAHAPSNAQKNSDITKAEIEAKLTGTITSHTHTGTEITDITEAVQDIVGGMVSTNTESGIAVTYDDTAGKLNFDVNDPVVTLTGDVTGSATMTNLGNISITTTVADDSHNHVISNIDGLQTALDGKVDDSQVLTNVPAGALFTDTVYTHPANHPPSIISQDASNRFVTDTEKNTWNSKQNALGFTPENVSNKGIANGYAELDATGKVPTNQLPSYVDDVLEYDSQANFPLSGETGKIYVTKDTNKTYRWSGSDYVEISQSLALGETSTTAYRGDKGKTAYEHSQTDHAPSDAQKNSDITKAEIEAKLTGTITTHTHTGLMPADHSTNHITGGSDIIPNAVASGASGLMSGADKDKLDGVEDNANNYIHPTTAGNKHVPTGGAAGQVLVYGGSSGTAAWGTVDTVKITVAESAPSSPVAGDFWYEVV